MVLCKSTHIYADFDKHEWSFVSTYFERGMFYKYQTHTPDAAFGACGRRCAWRRRYFLQYVLACCKVSGNKTHPDFSKSAWSECSNNHHLIRHASYQVSDHRSSSSQIFLCALLKLSDSEAWEMWMQAILTHENCRYGYDSNLVSWLKIDKRKHVVPTAVFGFFSGSCWLFIRCCLHELVIHISLLYLRCFCISSLWNLDICVKISFHGRVPIVYTVARWHSIFEMWLSEPILAQVQYQIV